MLVMVSLPIMAEYSRAVSIFAVIKKALFPQPVIMVLALSPYKGFLTVQIVNHQGIQQIHARASG